MSLIVADVTQFAFSFANLSRSTTLNDIYRTLGMNQQHAENGNLRRQDDKYIDDATDAYKDYEEGDITGFMVEKPLTNSGANSFDVSSNFIFLLSARSNGKLCNFQQSSLPQATAGAKTGEGENSFHAFFLFIKSFVRCHLEKHFLSKSFFSLKIQAKFFRIFLLPLLFMTFKIFQMVKFVLASAHFSFPKLIRMNCVYRLSLRADGTARLFIRKLSGSTSALEPAPDRNEIYRN